MTRSQPKAKPRAATREPHPPKPSSRTAAKPPARPFKLPALRVDPEKYPNLPANPSLERALRIRQALDQGRPRDEAVALAEQAMGPRGRRSKPKGRR